MAKVRRASVYVIECQGYVKIGIADYAGFRLQTLQTGNPFTLTLLAHAQFTDVVATENQLHKLYSQYRHRGEWFKLPPRELQELLRLFGPPDEPAKQDCGMPDPEYWSH